MFSATSAPTRSLPFLESCLLWILNIIRRSRRRRTMLWSSYTRTLLRRSKCFSILPFRLCGNPITLFFTDTLLSECQNSAFDLCQMLFEFLGKTIVQPRRDLFEKATGLSVSHFTSSSFLTRAESESAMATAWQHNLISTHINAVRSNTFGGHGRGNGKNSRCGAKRGAGRGGS